MRAVKRSRVVVAAVVVLTLGLMGCEKRTVPQSAAVADSTRLDSARRDSLADSTRIIGYDSAFGPIGSIDDSTGKLVEFPVRRP